MKIETKYDIGQVVWQSYIGKKTKKLTCDFCGGTGLITGQNSKNADCPICRAKRVIYQTVRDTVICTRLYVQNIIIYKVEDEVRIKYTVSARKSEFNKTTTVSEKSLYPTKKEAEAALARRRIMGGSK